MLSIIMFALLIILPVQLSPTMKFSHLLRVVNLKLKDEIITEKCEGFFIYCLVGKTEVRRAVKFQVQSRKGHRAVFSDFSGHLHSVIYLHT